MTIAPLPARPDRRLQWPEPMDPLYRQIRDLVYKVSGIYKAEEKLYLLADGCARRMKHLQARSLAGILGPTDGRSLPRRGNAGTAQRDHHRRDLPVSQPAATRRACGK